MNTPTTPTRLSKIDDLVLSLVLTAHSIDRIKNEPAEVNAALALCEIAVSLPSSWFTEAEQTLVGILVRDLGIDPKEFIDNIRNGSISYYAKASETAFNETGHRIAPMQKIVAECLSMHIKQFGLL